MRQVTIITNSDFSGILFLNSISLSGLKIAKIYVVSSLRGGIGSKLRQGIDLFSTKSRQFLLYRTLVEKLLFKFKLIDGKNILTIDQIGKKHNIDVVKVDDVNDSSFISEFDGFDQSQIVLSAYGSQIFPKALIEKVNHFWNIHGAYLPYFQGAAPYFWMLYKDQHPRGVTIHKVSQKLDAGPIIAQREVLPAKEETLLLYHARCVLEAAQLFIDVINQESWKTTDQITDERLEKSGLPLSSDVREFKSAGRKFFESQDFNRIKELV